MSDDNDDLERAKGAEFAALSATDPWQRDALLSLAAQWRELAEEAKARAADSSHDRGADTEPGSPIEPHAGPGR